MIDAKTEEQLGSDATATPETAPSRPSRHRSIPRLLRVTNPLLLETLDNGTTGAVPAQRPPRSRARSTGARAGSTKRACRRRWARPPSSAQSGLSGRPDPQGGNLDSSLPASHLMEINCTVSDELHRRLDRWSPRRAAQERRAGAGCAAGGCLGRASSATRSLFALSAQRPRTATANSNLLTTRKWMDLRADLRLGQAGDHHAREGRRRARSCSPKSSPPGGMRPERQLGLSARFSPSALEAIARDLAMARCRRHDGSPAR